MGLFAKKAVMQGMVGGAAVGTLAGLSFYAYEEFKKNGGHLEAEMPTIPKDFDSLSRDLDTLFAKLRKTSNDAKKMAFEL